MQTPQIASGEAYASETGSEERSNYIAGSLFFTTAYDDNVVGTGGSAKTPVSDVSYMIRPSISLNETTSRQGIAITYSPGFTFYEPTSELSQSNESLSAHYHYRLASHATATAVESFSKSSGVFSQPDSTPGGVVSGSPQPSQVVAPYAEQISNLLTGSVNYQYALNGSVGATGNFSTFSFPNEKQSQGLDNSNNSGVGGYWTSRLARTQYLGVKYQFERGVVTPKTGQSEALTHDFNCFYSFLVGPKFSISVSAGPEYVIASQSGVSAESRSWEPSVTAGMGWQGTRASFAAGLLREVSSGSGLIGAYQTTMGNATVRWRLSKDWTVGARMNYQIQKNAVPGFLATTQGGHTLEGGFTAGREIGQRLRLEFGYDRIHQSYSGVSSIESAPDNNHLSISIAYSIARPLGR